MKKVKEEAKEEWKRRHMFEEEAGVKDGMKERRKSNGREGKARQKQEEGRKTDHDKKKN